MIKLIIFDLDGVLISAKQIHYDTLNLAISEIDDKYKITIEEHLSIYDGLKTNEKLKLLTEKKGLPENKHQQIWDKKQELTLKSLSQIKKDDTLVCLFETLKQNNYLLACCSNSIRKSVFVMLSKLGIIEYMDLILSNEDVKSSKPYPEIYWNAMSTLKVLPEDTLIVEDSPNGLLAASRSGANILRVRSPKDLSFSNINNKILKIEGMNNISKSKWQDDKLNILIPMAGAGSRFSIAGYTFPKPLIDVNGKPMIQVVVDNLNIDAKYIYIVRTEHRYKYNLDTLLKLITPNYEIIEVSELTEGAACTTLLASSLIDNEKPLLIANSDQYIEWNSSEFMYKMNESDADGGILTFKSTHPKWSFVKVDNYGFVSEVAEKKPISDLATVGIYYWKKGSDYIKYTNQMINKNVRVNNEFYVAPVYNEAISDNKKVKVFNVKKMYGIGTPEDLDYFLKNK